MIIWKLSFLEVSFGSNVVVLLRYDFVFGATVFLLFHLTFVVVIVI